MDQTPAEQLHSPEEWDSIRDIFTKLYQAEGRTLEMVRNILARDYEFIAT